MAVKLLSEHHLEFLSLKEAAQAGSSLHLSKYHIVGNHMSWLNCLILCLLGNSADFFQTQLFSQKKIQEYYLSVKQFGSRS